MNINRFYQRNPWMVISKFNFCSVFHGAWLNAILPTNVILLASENLVFTLLTGMQH